MKTRISCIWFLVILICGVSVVSQAIAEESPMDRADAAVANILFDYEYSEEYTSYMIKDDGFVDVTFASNIPEKLYSEILGKLNNHPDINGVLAGKTGAYCARF